MIQDEALSLADNFDNLAVIFSVYAAVLVGIGFLCSNVIKHTKTESKESLGIGLSLLGVVIAIAQLM